MSTPTFPRKTFEKRIGTTDRGRHYEDVMAAHFALKFTLQKNVQNFQMSSNDKDFGDFDDVVMDISYRSGERLKYAIQLKHSHKIKPLMSPNLMAVKGDFSLQKYCKGFIENLVNTENEKFMYVLYTNKSLKQTDKELQLEGKEHFSVRIHKEQQPCVVLATSKNGTQYRCEISASEETLRNDEAKVEYEQYEEFFKHFLICTDQSDVSGIQAIVSNTFESEFGCEADSYLGFVTKWSQCDGKKLFLDKETVKFKLGECLLNAYCAEHIIVPDIDDNRWKIFKETILQFDVTILQTVNSGSQRRMVDNLDTLDGDDIEKTARRYELAVHEPKEKLRVLWHLNKVPLIVKVDESNREFVLKIVELCKGKKFVLCGGSVTRTDLAAGLEVFENVSDLDRVDSNILKNCMVSIQGKQKVEVEAILDHDRVKSLVTTRTLLEMLGEYNVGEKQDELPEYYIKRSMTKTILDLKCLKNTNNSDIFVISCDKSSLQSLIENELIDLTDYLSDTSRNKIELNRKVTLVTKKQNVTKEQLEKIAARNPDKALHHASLIDNNKLELITSKGSIRNLKQFRLPNEEHTSEEDEILKSEHVLNIVCAAPGMGKSVLMKYLKKNYSSEYWVIYIDLKLHYSHFKLNDSSENILDYIENIGSDEYSELDKSIRKSFQEDKKAVFLWDALDEVPAENVEAIVEAVLKLKDCGYKQWIASRSHLQMSLEDKFDTFALNIVELSESQQKDYINRRLMDEAKATKLHKEVRGMHSEFLGVPLLLFILTELFLKKKDDWNFSSGMARSVLYRYFIDEQFRTYYAKTECNLANHIMKDILNEYQSNRLEQYELMGAVSCFGEKISKKKTKCREIVEKFISDGVGIITDVKNDLPVFFHQTFGEYFAASWLTKNYSKVKNLDTWIFQEEFRGVRFMMDSILAEDCPAHLAVLHRNLEGLRKCSTEICEKRDKKGRNVLQILSSWGKTHPLLDYHHFSAERQGAKLGDLLYLVDLTPGFSIVPSTLESIVRKLPCRSSEEIVYENLLRYSIESIRCDPSEKDTLFGWNTFSYADAALCLYPLEVLLTKHKINFNILKNYSDICTVLCYSVLCDYQLLFETVESVPPILFTDFGGNLLHLATQFASCDCLSKVLDLKFDHENIVKVEVKLDHGESMNFGMNSFFYFTIKPEWFHCKFINFSKMDIKCPYQTTDDKNSSILFGYSPLHVASQNGHLDKVRILIKHNAKVDNCNEHYNVTPLHLAVIEGHIDIVKYLIKNNAKTDVENLSGFKLLHLAAFHGHLEVMEFLILKKICKVDCKARFYDITPLHVAAANGQLEAIKYLVLNGAKVNAKVNLGPTSLKFVILGRRDRITTTIDPKINGLLNERQGQKFGPTALHFASFNGHITAVEFLIGQGCRITVEDIMKEMPIAYAVRTGQMEIVEYLVQRCERTRHLGGINEQNLLGNTCLHCAIRAKNLEMCELLVDLGADIEKTDIYGNTPLLISAVVNSVRILEILMKNGANIHAVNMNKLNIIQMAAGNDSVDVFKFLKTKNFDMNIRDEYKNNLLHIAAGTGSYEVAKLLIEDAVFEINERNEYGNTPLHLVVRCISSNDCYSEKEALKLLSLLLDHNADVNAGLCYHVASPLHFAVIGEKFCPEAVKLLLQNGAKPNICVGNRIIPILECTKHGHLETVQLLLESGADPYSRDNVGNTCLHYASDLGYTEIVEKLLEHISPNETNSEGQTPLHLACARTNLKIIQVLKQKGARDDIEDENGDTATNLLLFNKAKDFFWG